MKTMLIDIGDMTLHYDLHGAGEPLLWLHGTLGHGPDWRYIFPDPPAGYQLIAPDLRGHGRSTGAAATYCSDTPRRTLSRSSITSGSIASR